VKKPLLLMCNFKGLLNLSVIHKVTLLCYGWMVDQDVVHLMASSPNMALSWYYYLSLVLFNSWPPCFSTTLLNHTSQPCFSTTLLNHASQPWFSTMFLNYASHGYNHGL
jgi:hypothetical protein